jgi:hypothetical protein
LSQSLAEPTGSPAFCAAPDEKFAQNLNISDSVNRLRFQCSGEDGQGRACFRGEHVEGLQGT